MYEVNITKEMLIKAIKLNEEMGRLKNSIKKGKGNIMGFLGELAIAKIFNTNLKHSFDYDLIINNKKVDVKTKACSVKPSRDFFDCSVSAINPKQKCDYYYFVNILNNYSKLWILGFYPKKKYIKDSRLYKKGDIDKRTGFKFKAPSYNLRINKLYRSKRLKNFNKRRKLL